MGPNANIAGPGFGPSMSKNPRLGPVAVSPSLWPICEKTKNRSVEDGENVAFLHVVSFGDANFADTAGIGRFDRDLHLHGFEN